MANRLKVLFVCSKNQWRSPTAEAIYRDDPRVSVRSRGTSRAAARPIRDHDLAWADVVLVMEHTHRRRLLSDFPVITQSRKIHVLDIPDEYGYMDADLVESIRAATEPIIDDYLENV